MGQEALRLRCPWEPGLTGRGSGRLEGAHVRLFSCAVDPLAPIETESYHTSPRLPPAYCYSPADTADTDHKLTFTDPALNSDMLSWIFFAHGGIGPMQGQVGVFL
jgi:hypothetical protein